MKILVYGNGSLSVAQQERKLCVEFAKAGHQVHLLTDTQRRLFDVGEIEKHENLKVYHMPYSEYRFDYIPIEEKMDVVLGMDQSVAPLCLEYQKRLKTPAYCMYLDFPVHVVDPNGSAYNFDYSQRFYYWIMCGLELEGVIFNNTVAVEEFFKRYRKEAHLVWYAVSNDNYLEDRKKSPLADTGSTNDFIFGLNRIIPYKGMEYIMEALKHIKAPYKHAYVSADEKYFSKIKKLASELPNDITFIEKLSEQGKMEHLYNSRVVVYPQVTEWVGGMSIIEGWSTKTAGVCFDYPVLRELYDDCVLYANPKDSEDLGKKIDMLYKDNDLRNEITKKGWDRFSHHFTREAMVNSILEIIE